MAINKINRVFVEKETTAYPFTFTAGVTAGNGLDYEGEDEKTLVVFNNTGSAGNATVVMGDGIQGVQDIKVDVPAGFSAMVLESGSFKQLSGDNKGQIIVKPSASSITIAVVELR